MMGHYGVIVVVTLLVLAAYRYGRRSARQRATTSEDVAA
jgi:hypothetical protein